MSRPPDPAFQDWIARAKAATGDEMLAVAQRLGAQVKRAGGAEWVGPCPNCQGRDRFSINPKRTVWNCRGAGGGHDAIGMVMHIAACDFLAACEEITGEPPPRGEGRRMDPEVGRERRRDRVADQVEQGLRDREERLERRNRSQQMWDAGVPIEGTHASAYLRSRGIDLRPEIEDNLRFHPSMVYKGFSDPDASEEVSLGRFPCMLAAIRNVDGDLIGVHRTFLSPDKPRKLSVGDHRRNNPKKVFDSQKTGHVRLNWLTTCAAIGEGIETVLAWDCLRRAAGPDDAIFRAVPDDVTLLTSVSLGNLSGGCSPEGHPDYDNPGILLPPIITDVIILGDGDSERAGTVRRILAASRRFIAQGRSVSVHMADDGKDFGDIWSKKVVE